MSESEYVGATFGKFMHLETGEDLIITTMRTGLFRQPIVALDSDGPIVVPRQLTHGPGAYLGVEQLWFDPGSGRHMLVAVHVVRDDIVIKVHREDPPLSAKFEEYFVFDVEATGEDTPGLEWLSSPEPFVWNDKSYLLFLIGDAASFPRISNGNMRRVEPEVYLTEDEPLVFYTETIKESVTDPVLGTCRAHSSTLRAARTGLPSPRAP
jgi:hypothetical protein